MLLQHQFTDCCSESAILERIWSRFTRRAKPQAHTCFLLPAAGCATVAEVRKRGPEFWDEFEFYLSDLVVGCVLDVVLVSLMAPVAPLSARKPPNRSGELVANRST